MNNKFDVIIIGAGSVGTPTAYSLSKAGLKVCVIEKESAPGKGQNRAAIGGIRATHSDFSKIKLCQESIDIFSEIEEETGIDISWYQGGYLYPIYTEKDKQNVLDLLKIQKSFGLDIDWIDSTDVKELVPGINNENLLGGIYSPKDGSASPLKSNYLFYIKSVEYGAVYHFNTEVIDFIINNEETEGVKTTSGNIFAEYIINCAGISADKIPNISDSELQLMPDLHEAGICEPVNKFIQPMIVDIRNYPGSKNAYFYQNKEGQIIFCLTPDPSIYGNSDEATPGFLPLVVKRILNLYPSIGNLRIRRTWRGYYPNTKDGLPYLDVINKRYIIAAGMCGQGYMLGPGIAGLITRYITNNINKNDTRIWEELKISRSFDKVEFFK